MRITGFERDGLRFEVRDDGPLEGPAVVLLHGFPQDGECWGMVARRLHERGLRTLVPDQRGYSPGARARARRAYRNAELVGDVVALLDAAGLESAHLVGHDWGGAVAWAVAGLHPRRVSSLVVLSTPHPRAFSDVLSRSNQGLKSWYLAAYQLPWLPELMLSRLLRRLLLNAGLSPASVEHSVALMNQPGALRGALNWYRGLAFDLRSAQPRSTVPTTYVWGRHDPILGRAAATRTAEYVTGPYRFEELDAGHWLPETHAAQVAELIADRAVRA